ncbi:MAG: T9SS type A sorting domain-containing protein [Bacteroidales bacterium]|nr:T9SS type A sorting domain-containing protein [Bacteroidales bacterium]
MTKKLLSLAAAALLMTGAAAQSIEFDQSDIQYWVGTGSNSAVVVIGWDNCTSGNNFALAWGVHWNGSVTAVNMLDTIATYDSRVQYNISSGFVTSIGYNDGTLIATPGSGSYWCYGVNGGFADAYSIQPIVDGDLMEISSSCYFSLTSATAATDPNGPAPSDTTVTPTNPVDATIAFSDILYWVGQGTDSAAFIVNYAQPDTAFAWGFLFNGTTTAQAMIDSIAAADPRFWYTGSPSMGGDIHFITDDGDTLGLSPVGTLGYNFWWANLNGRSAGAGIGATLHNGDVFKYGDLNSATGWDPMGTYFMEEAWLTAPTPVAPPAAADTTPVPAALCDSVYALPYTEAFSNCTAGQNPCEAGAPLPECWTVLSNGRYTRDVDPEEYIYFSGIGTSTSTNNYGCIAVGDPFFSFIAAEIYNGTDFWYNEDMLDMGTRKYAILPAFERPLSQLAISFDYRTSKAGAALLIGYVVSDTADFVALDSIASDFRVLHRVDSLRLDSLSNSIPDSARLALCWKATATTTSYVGNIYCGIDNFRVMAVASDTTTPDTTSAPVEATIAASEILYWVGHGSNEAVLAVNWADTALAWGYRFDGSATVADMMDAIAAADPRFSYVGSTGSLSDILYIDTAAGMTDTLRGTPGSWWGSTNNGVMDAGMGQALANGDFEKWADPAAGVVVDSTYWEGYGWGYTYVYPMTITPVSVPDTATTPDDPVIPEHGPFCGPAGTEGSNAIAGNSDLFVAWATGITLQRGPDNIAIPNSPLATYGDDTMALGPVVMTDNLKVVSLGDGGMATLTFAQPITNGDGPDFAVFENGFDDYFLELAFVEVSSDGNRFVRFPATSLTQTETQATRLDPTFINNLAGKYRMGYGTPFDLEELRDSTGINIDSITHVRIIDVVGSIDPQYATYDAFGHIVNDPWPTAGYGSSGFDLDAVGVIHQLEPQQAIGDVDQLALSLWPNPAADHLNVTLERAAEALLYDLTGRQLAAYSLVAGRNILDISSLDAGVYMLRVEGTACKIIKK